MSGTLEFGEDRCSHIHPSSAWSFLLFSVLSSVDVRKRIGKEKTLEGSPWFLLRLQEEDTCRVLGKQLVKNPFKVSCSV